MVAPAAAHPHQVHTRSHSQVLANGQNHPGFQPVNAEALRLSCAGTLEPANSGPADYGLEDRAPWLRRWQARKGRRLLRDRRRPDRT